MVGGLAAIMTLSRHRSPFADRPAVDIDNRFSDHVLEFFEMVGQRIVGVNTS